MLCAGAWISELFPEGRDIFAVPRQLLYWFPIREGYEQLRDGPIFIWEFEGEPRDLTHLVGCYGFPAVDGPAGGVKVAAESFAHATTSEDPRHPATQAEIGEIYERYVAPHLLWLGAKPLRTVSCLYTSTRRSQFVIDRHPTHDAVLIVSPCSGHGFKHSAAIGEAVAQWVTERTTDIDLSGFSLSQASTVASRPHN